MQDFHGAMFAHNDCPACPFTTILTALDCSPVAVLTGSLRWGKTTLTRELALEDSARYFDLEDPVSLARLDEPVTALGPLRSLVVIDEIQRRPDLFPVLRVPADHRDRPARFPYAVNGGRPVRNLPLV